MKLVDRRFRRVGEHAKRSSCTKQTTRVVLGPSVRQPCWELASALSADDDRPRVLVAPRPYERPHGPLIRRSNGADQQACEESIDEPLDLRVSQNREAPEDVV